MPLLSILFQKSEPMSLGSGMAMFFVMLVVTLIVLGVGGYIFVRVLAGIINQRRDSWELAAAELGLSVDHTTGPINKDMIGTRDGRSVWISRYSVPRGEYSADHYVAVEISINVPFDFSFEIKRPEMFFQQVASFLSEDTTIGHEPFDKAFTIETSDTRSLMELLNVEMLDGENSNLIGDLMAARKKHHRVKATDLVVSLSSLTPDPGDTTPIKPTFQRAVLIAKRFEQAARKIANTGQPTRT